MLGSLPGTGDKPGAKPEDPRSILARKGSLAARSSTGLGASGTSAIESWRRAQAGQGTERRICRQSCPQWFLSAPGWDLSHKQGAEGFAPQDEHTKCRGDTDTTTHHQSPPPTTQEALTSLPTAQSQDRHPTRPFT